jgi:hypothetical protein
MGGSMKKNIMKEMIGSYLFRQPQQLSAPYHTSPEEIPDLKI